MHRETNTSNSPDFPDAELVFDETPLERAHSAPASWYVDPRVHTVDLELIASAWQYIGPAADVVAPGQCTVAEVAGRSLAVVRGEDGLLRAFHNVCRHRGGPLLREKCTVPRLQCQYHGWVYSLDGRLLGTPQFRGAEGFDRAGITLAPVRVDEWQGLVFVNTAPSGAGAEQVMPLAESLAGIAEALLPVRLHRKRFAVREVFPVACNWKTYVDNYMEAYHLPTIHPAYFRTLDFTAYRYDVHERWSVQRAPIGEDAGYYAELKEAGVEHMRDACYVWAWPNLTLNVLPGRVQVNLVRPLAVDRCEVVFDYYYDDPAAMVDLIAEDRAVSARIQAEDADICQVVQRNLASGAYQPGRLSPEHESALHGFQRSIRHAYRAHLSRAGEPARIRSIR